MEVYAWIDEGTVLTTLDESVAPKGSQKYIVSSIDHLIISEGKITIDTSIEDTPTKIRKHHTNIGKKAQLKDQILNHLIEKELLANNIINTISLTQEEYLNILNQYNKIILE